MAFKKIVSRAWDWLKSGDQEDEYSSPWQQILAQTEAKNPLEAAVSTTLQTWNFLTGGLLYGLGLTIGFVALMVMSLNQGFWLNVAEVGTLQFLVAGIIPGFLVFVVVGVARVIIDAPKWVRSKRGPPWRRLRLFLKIISILMFGFSFVMAIIILVSGVIGSIGFTPGNLKVWSALWGVISLTFGYIALAFVTDEAESIYRYNVVYGFVLLLLGGFVLYPLLVLPWLPQEFGGARQRCVRVDVQTAELTANTIWQLNGGSQPERDSATVTSFNLYQLFSSADNIFVRVPVIENPSEQQILKLNKDIIRSSKASQSCPAEAS